MSNLPYSSSLPVDNLSAVFQNTTNSYKFYWFLSILEHVQLHQTSVIPINMLKSRMIASIWYPALYFQLSFGKQDQLVRVAQMLNRSLEETDNIQYDYLIAKSDDIRKESPDFAKAFHSLGRYVPYRFLEPFFRATIRGAKDSKKDKRIIELASKSFISSATPCLYRFTSNDTELEIHPDWYHYLQLHLTILKDYCLWNLLNYLQKHNPNVPNIAGKLFLPKSRNLENARKYWRHVLEHSQEVRCIYSNELISRQNLSLDHFLPWRYVTHDLLWNITPTVKLVNSSKGDQLPDIKAYFNTFAAIQRKALRTIENSRFVNARLIEDYIILFGCENYAQLMTISSSNFQDKLYETIAPQFQIAHNMGFAGNWIYSP